METEQKKSHFKTILFIVTGVLLIMGTVLVIGVKSYLSLIQIGNQNDEAFQLIDNGEFEKGLELIEKILEEDPDNDNALNNKGWALSQIGRHEEAIEALTKSLEIDPNDEFEYTNIGNAHLGLENYEEAIKAYKTAIDYGGTINIDSAYYGLAVAYFEMQKYRKSITYFKEYLYLTPGDIDAYWYLATAYDFDGQVNQALNTMETVIRMNRSDIEAHTYKGDLLLKNRDFPAAVKVYEEIIEKYPNQAHGYYGKAQIFTLRSKRKEAFTYLQKSFSIDPYYSEFSLTDPLLSSLRKKEEFWDLMREYDVTIEDTL